MLSVILASLIVTFAVVQIAKAQAPEELKTFYSKDDWPGISLIVGATSMVLPAENLTIELVINCTALGVKINRLQMSVYGFSEGKEKTQLANITVTENATLEFNKTLAYDYSVLVPSDVWDATYADLSLKYFIYSSGFEYNPSFSITVVRNIYYEQLQEDFRNLNASFYGIQDDYKALNSSYWQLNTTYEELNKTYWDIKGNSGELDSARSVAVILGITTAFFVITTIFLFTRKPKDHW